MDFARILQYYALICLANVPVQAGLFAYLNRKTKHIQKLNAWIDHVLGLSPVQEETDNKNSVKEEGSIEEKQVKPAELPASVNNDKVGIATLRLRIGDIYYCRLSSAHRESKRYDLAWYSKNEFVGKIDDNAVFEARKTGTAIVGCQRIGVGYDTGSDMYEINVIPTNKSWFAEPMLKALENKTKRDILMSSMVGVRIISDDTEKNIVTYEGDQEYRSMKIQFNDYGEIERVLYELRTDCPTLADEMKERFEPVRLSGEGLTAWARCFADESKEEILQFAILRKYEDGKIYFGMSQFWREFGEYEEFELNIALAEKTFADLLPDRKPAKVKAFRRRPVSKRPAPIKSSTTPKETDTSAENNAPAPDNQEMKGKEEAKENLVEDIQKPAEKTEESERETDPDTETGAQDNNVRDKEEKTEEPDEDEHKGIDSVPDIAEDGELDKDDVSSKETGELDFNADETRSIIEEEN